MKMRSHLTNLVAQLHIDQYELKLCKEEGRAGKRHTAEITFVSKVAGSTVLMLFATLSHFPLKTLVISELLALVFMKGLENRKYSQRWLSIAPYTLY
jgi:hypothetical protein